MALSSDRRDPAQGGRFTTTRCRTPETLVDTAVRAVELRIEQDGYGSAITVLAYGDVPQLPDETRRWVKYRLGTIFGAALREWVDEPH